MGEVEVGNRMSKSRMEKKLSHEYSGKRCTHESLSHKFQLEPSFSHVVPSLLWSNGDIRYLWKLSEE